MYFRPSLRECGLGSWVVKELLKKPEQGGLFTGATNPCEAADLAQGDYRVQRLHKKFQNDISFRFGRADMGVQFDWGSGAARCSPFPEN